MDELVESLATGFSVTNIPNDTARDHPRYSQYKQKSTGADQHSRRQSLLERQKQKRDDLVNLARKIGESSQKGESGFSKDQLMLSEWLVDVPEDLVTSWYMVPVPVGKRSFVIASHGATKVYAKGGSFVRSFQSALPGGSSSSPGSYCLLDCIWCELEKTYYVLDLMCWKAHPFYDCETEFRFNWLTAKMVETPQITEISDQNQYRFIQLPYTLCETTAVTQQLLADMPFTSELDGLLFYHRLTHYTPGPTPLVTWLKPFMVPEILNIDIAEQYLSSKPKSYISAASYINYFNEKQERIKQKKREKRTKKKGSERMETAEDSQGEGGPVVEPMEETGKSGDV